MLWLCRQSDPVGWLCVHWEVRSVLKTPDDGCCDTRNMYSSFAVNKYLHTVASVGILFTLNYNARNHELKIVRF